jgi:hypothetical protein
MKSPLWAAALFSVGGLTACDPPARSVSYFQSHDADRRQVLASCKMGQGRGQECATAAQAEAQATSSQAESEFRAVLKDK